VPPSTKLHFLSPLTPSFAATAVLSLQMLERSPTVCNEVFMRAWRKSSTAAELGDEDGAKLWRLNGLNDVRE
jgi:hypothetical protein